MDFELKNTSATSKTLYITLPVEAVDKKCEKEILEAMKSSNIPGFRPGRVPRAEVNRRYGEQIRAEIVNSSIEESINKVIDEHSLRPIGEFNLDIDQNIPGQQLKFHVAFDVIPNVDLIDPKTIELRIPEVEINDADIDKVIEKYRKHHAEHEKKEGHQAESGDLLCVDMIIRKIDGVELTTEQENKVQKKDLFEQKLILGEDSFLAGFDSHLSAIKEGENKVIDFLFPTDYYQELLQGKTATIEIVVKSVAVEVLPEVDADFVKKMGFEPEPGENEIKQMRENIEKSLHAHAEQLIYNHKKAQIFAKLTSKHELELPAIMLKEQVDILAKEESNPDSEKPPHQDNNDIEADEDNKQLMLKYGTEAGRIITSQLAMQEFIKNYNVVVEEQQIKDFVYESVQQYDNPEEVAQLMLKNNKILRNIEASLKEKKALQMLYSLANVTRFKVSWDELETLEVDSYSPVNR